MKKPENVKQVMSWLKVSESFYSIQGEGVTMGVPSVFLRLTSCNLLCKSDQWVCDTIEVWKKGNRKTFSEVLNPEEITCLQDGSHLVITGGEPLLQQDRVAEYIEYLTERLKKKPYVEIETNGTITPMEELIPLVDQWNCSPKLKNSGETYERRFKEIPLRTINGCDNSWFKFVINRREDFEDILQDFDGVIDFNKLILMPSGETQEELNESRKGVIELCRDMGIRYCDRLHIVAWNKKTGV